MAKKIYAWTLFFIVYTVSGVFGQDSITAKLDRELNSMQYDSLTTISVSKVAGYPAEAAFDIGMAWSMKNDDDNCISFMSLAINKAPHMTKAYYYRGISFSSIEKYLEAISDFREAISLDPSNSEYYTSLGDVYFKIPQYDSALQCYKSAIAQKQPEERAYSMIAQVYDAQNMMDKALGAYYFMKSKVPQSSDYYKIALYNIGLLEILNANYDKAEPVLKEFIRSSRMDYRAHPLLMQVYYGKKEYDSATTLRDTLYKAYAKGRLRKTLKDRFCFDQFKWKDKHVEAYEKFETPRNKGDSKLIFFVFDQGGNIVLSIQTEYDPMLVELGTEMKYDLGESIGDKDVLFPKQFGNNINYDELKQTVLDVLDGKLKPKIN